MRIYMIGMYIGTYVPTHNNILLFIFSLSVTAADLQYNLAGSTLKGLFLSDS